MLCDRCRSEIPVSELPDQEFRAEVQILLFLEVGAIVYPSRNRAKNR